jgi:hypothetical protein
MWQYNAQYKPEYFENKKSKLILSDEDPDKFTFRK